MEEAIITLQALQDEESNYEDVEVRLAMARHLVQLSSLLREAMTSLEEEAYTASIHKLDELQQKGADYKGNEVARLRQEVLNQLQQKAESLLRVRKRTNSRIRGIIEQPRDRRVVL